MNGISALINRHRELASSRRSPLRADKTRSSSHEMLAVMSSESWTLQFPDLWEINVCCGSHPAYGIFVTAAQAKTDPNKNNSTIVHVKWLGI